MTMIDHANFVAQLETCNIVALQVQTHMLGMTNWFHCVAMRLGLGPETERDGTGREGNRKKTVTSREMESGSTLERLLYIRAKLIDHN